MALFSVALTEGGVVLGKRSCNTQGSLVDALIELFKGGASELRVSAGSIALAPITAADFWKVVQLDPETGVSIVLAPVYATLIAPRLAEAVAKAAEAEPEVRGARKQATLVLIRKYIPDPAQSLALLNELRAFLK
jgi:hypothetical protein